VAFLAVRNWRAHGQRHPILLVAAGAVGTYLTVTLPLLLDPIRLVSGVLGNAGMKRFVSVSAPNPWALLFGYRVPDDGYVFVGAALFIAGLVAALLTLRRGHDLWTLLTVGTLIVFAFYFLPTRVHERYLFPAMALMAPFAVTSRWSLAAYVAISLAFAASLLASLSISMPSTIGTLPFADALRTPASVWALGLTLAVAALAQVWLTLRRTARPAVL
jgi:hypothetical protein